MPAVSEKQRKFMGAELARKHAGKKTRTGMSETQLSEFASKKKVHIPGGSYHELVEMDYSVHREDQTLGGH